MNIERLREAEAEFLREYPGGFADPKLVPVTKRHNVGRMTAFCREQFGAGAFGQVAPVMDNLTRAVARASMVSMFDKPKFRDFIAGLGGDERAGLAAAVKSMLHGRASGQQRGFEFMVELLDRGKLARWSLVTIVPSYFHPDREVFVMPTTAKGVIATFELEGLTYRPRPSWSFYREYRRQILLMRDLVDRSLAPNNAAFCGFLMISSGGRGRR